MKISLSILMLLVGAAQLQGATPTTAPTTQPVSIQTAIDRGVKFLIKDQNADGSWGTGAVSNGNEIYSMVPGSLKSFQLAASALSVMALREVGEKTAHDKGLEFLLTAPDVKRDDGSLLYNTWAYMYMVQALSEEILHGNTDPRIKEVCKRSLKDMDEYATYMGGWSYYDFHEHTQSPAMAPTSFGTAAGLVALYEAKQAGLEVPEKLVTLSLHRLEECRLPNGVFLYGSDYKYIPTLRANRPQGAVGRTQPANYALWLWKSKETNVDRINEGLQLFFKDHMFLDMGRKRPIPHESWYQTSGYYYYFDHYYASRLLEAIEPGQARNDDAKQIAAGVLGHQEDDGSWWDFAMWDFHKPYGTAFAIMTLLRCDTRLLPVTETTDSIVYVADMSGSMINKVAILKDELAKSVDSLSLNQSFDVVIYAKEGPLEMLNRSLVKATPEMKKKDRYFLEAISSTGIPDPLASLQAALKLHPSELYFVTDSADFRVDHAAVCKRIGNWNEGKKTRINTILLVENKTERGKNVDAEPLMKQLAKENGGAFKWVEIDSLDD